MKCPVCNKNIPENSLKCPYCKTRTGLLCSHCNTVNPIGNFVCQNCSKELLKICPHCNSVNFPSATKCRKCGKDFNEKVEKRKKKIIQKPALLKYVPKLYSFSEAVNLLNEGIKSKDKKIFSITGSKGAGKSSVLKKVVESNQNLHWCIGKCSQLTQLSSGGVVQSMLLNLFNLPSFFVSNQEFEDNAIKFLKKEFKFLSKDEVTDLLNFLYNYDKGEYEDIIINKKRTHSILHKIFEAFVHTDKFVIVVDNFDYIDGFSIEFFTHFMNNKSNLKNLKFIAIYSNVKPINHYFEVDGALDINLAPLSVQELGENIKLQSVEGTYITEREKDVIFRKSGGNPAFVEQGVAYSFDCQISDKAFLLPATFNGIIKERLKTLRKINFEAYRFLCCSAVVGEKIYPQLIKEVFEYDENKLNEIITYLDNASFIRKSSEIAYEFNNLYLWEVILKNITNDTVFEEINLKLGSILNNFNLNTDPILAMIAHNLKKNQMSFDVWTKITRLASYVGDINLYVIAQKQCLALINEFNDDETLEIRSNISERLGKILSEYDPEEAMEYLPDAIAFASDKEDEVKEIELLGYLTYCCKLCGNYFGNIECVDKVIKKISIGKELELALVKTTKLLALLNIGNCSEVINLIDNEIIPILDKYIDNPKLNNLFPPALIYQSRIGSMLVLAKALAYQGNKRVFEVIDLLQQFLRKNSISDNRIDAELKLSMALANTIKGDFKLSDEILEKIKDNDTIEKSEWNFVYVTNRFMQKQYGGIREKLFDAVTYANNIGDNFTKNILKVYLGKMLFDNNESKRAMDIYNEQITYFAKEKIATGALLSWYLIAQATEMPKIAIDIAGQALEIAKNPTINNYFFIIKLKILLAKLYAKVQDADSAKMYFEEAILMAKQNNLEDLECQAYYEYGNCCYEKMRGIQNEIFGNKMYENVLSKSQNEFLLEQVSQKLNKN